MTTPTPSRGLHAKLAEVYAAVERVPKNGTAPASMGGYRFVQAGDVADVIRTELARLKVTFLPEQIDIVESSSYQIGNGKTMFLVSLRVTWRIRDGESADECIVQSVGQGADMGDKAMPKAQTNAMKYALLMGFLVPTGDDPEASEHPAVPAQAVRPAVQQRPQSPAGHPASAPAHPAASMAPGGDLEPPFPGDYAPAPAPGDPSICPIDGVAYNGKPGDYWHKAADGTFHRPADQPRQPRRAN